MFAPQVVIQVVVRKAAELDPEVAREFLANQNYSGMTRTAATNSYIEGVINHSAGEVDWVGLADDLKNFSPAERALLPARFANGEMKLAREWVKEYPIAAMDWLVNSVEVDMNDQVTLGVGNFLASQALSLGPDVERLVGLLSHQEWRYDFVARFIQPQVRLPLKSLDGNFQFEQAELVNLVHAADLPPGKGQTCFSGLNRGNRGCESPNVLCRISNLKNASPISGS